MKRALALLAAALVLLAGCDRMLPPANGPQVPAPDTSSAPAVAAPTCPPEGVRLEMGTGDAASGLRVVGIELINCGSTEYRVDGYPAVRPLDEQRRPVDVQVLDGVREITLLPPWEGAPSPVVLAPGQQAEAVIVWRNTYTDITHPPVTVPLLEIAPAPGEPAQLLTPRSPLDLGSTGRFGVSAWHASEAPSAAPSASAPPLT